MSEERSPRSRPVRRALIAVARAVGLFILIAGLDGVFTLALPGVPPLYRDSAALLAGVVVFELLRPARRRPQEPVPVLSLQDDDRAAELAEAGKIIEGLRSEAERLREEWMEREAVLRQDEKELLEINNALRRQIEAQQEAAAGQAGRMEAVAAELQRELTIARQSLEEERRQRAEEVGEAREREGRLREQYESESEHLQKAAGRALEEIQRANAAAEALRGELERERGLRAEGVRELDAARSATAALAGERKDLQAAMANLRAEVQQEKRHAEAEMRELEAVRASAEALAAERQHLLSRLAGLEQQLAAAAQQLDASRSESETATALRQQLESQLADFDQRLASAMQELEALRAERQRVRREIEETRQRYEVEKNELRRAVEAEWSAKVQEATAGLAASRDSVLARADAAREALQQQIANERNEFRNRLEEQKTALERALESQWKARLEEATDKLAADRQQEISEMIADREAMRMQLRSATGRAEELGLALEQERQIGKQLKESASAFESELKSSREKLAALEERFAEQTGQPVDETVLRHSIETEYSAKIQKIVTELVSDQETEIGESIATREAARAEARSLKLRIKELEQELDRIRGELGGRKEQTEVAVDEAVLRHSIETEYSAKIQKIVTELVSDQENEIGESIAAREAARAEARSMKLRVKELEQELDKAREETRANRPAPDEIGRELDAERQTRRRLEDEIDALKAQISEGALLDKKALREAIDAEWSQKLQTVVNRVSADHEADIGKAVEEREAARNEARNLAIKVTALQQKIEGDRQVFAAAQEKWNATQESLAAQLRQTEEELASLRSAPPASASPPLALAAEPAPAPAQPTDFDETERRARADVLEFAEQAHAALRRSLPGNVPVPAVERRARVLFVHHDPAMRSMWRDKLGQSGFEVQTAVDGLEGLRLTMSAKPDVVIADASMPKMGGRELCQLIKSNHETSAVKVILMMGVYTNEAPIEAASREFEADELLRKPVKFEALKTALENLLQAS